MSVFREMYNYEHDEEFWRKDMLDDLQLAAELGKTLLERNKELEISLKQHQTIIEDQTQEIEYLTKQTVALREVNDSRLRIYEQLEVSIHDLERANHRLRVESGADKKQLKGASAAAAALEARCDELQAAVDDLTAQLDGCRRRGQQQQHDALACTSTPSKLKLAPDFAFAPDTSHDKQIQCDNPAQEKQICNSSTTTEPSPAEGEDDAAPECDGQLARLGEQLAALETERARETRRLAELEEQLCALVQENQALEAQLLALSAKEDDMKSMHEEFTTLDEVRQGLLCSRCLRPADDKSRDDLSLLDPEEEDEDSMLEALVGETRYHSSVSLNIQQDKYDTQPGSVHSQSNNLYRDLIEKYEALVAVNRTKPANCLPANCMSLQEELQMSGDFSSAHFKDTDEESGNGDSLNNASLFDKNAKNCKDRKSFAHTPTDFSEAETSSSGFADETSNKATQTDGRPGSFLCAIADGEDCKFSIYDDASPIDSRFRNSPEYRVLFKEIFTVLKKTAENKVEGEDLPLLDDTPAEPAPKVPPVTPANDDFPDFTDDNNSVVSSAVSEESNSINEPTVIENVKAEKKVKEEGTKRDKEKKVPTLTPLKREPLEYISVSVNVRKKSSSRKNNKKQQLAERSDSPVIPLSPRVNYLSNGNGQRKRKENRNVVSVDSSQVWNGTTMQFWASNRNVASPTPSQTSNRSFKYEKNVEFKPSPASHDLHKLKKLDLSYAEVLRNASNKKREALQKLQRK